ncbi:unnamed protein product [Peniophora sp. CBMAI 1063]|nr:unnamed protein product [Peniophora sp. CBMAI 1063]
MSACLTTPDQVTGLPESPSPLNNERKQNIKEAVQVVVEAVSFVSAVTENVPFLGAISKALTEIMKICDEVSEFDDERKAVKRVVSEIKQIVDTTRSLCDGRGMATDMIPAALVKPLTKLQECIDRTRKDIDACTSMYVVKNEGIFRAAASRTRRFARKVINRKVFLGTMKSCREDMNSTFALFCVALHIEHTMAQDDLTKKVNVLSRSISELIDLMTTIRQTPTDKVYASNAGFESVGHSSIPVDGVLNERDEPTTSAPPQVDQPLGHDSEQIDSERASTPVTVLDDDWIFLGRQVRAVISTFSRKDQDTIKRGLSKIFSWALELDSSGHGQELVPNSSSVTVGTAVSMAAIYLLLFMMWKLLSVVPHVFGWKPGSIIIVDILDHEWELHYDTFSTWETTDRFLKEKFKGRIGASYVLGGDYALGTTDRLRITRQEWSQVVRPKARLRMAVVVRERFPGCPFCRKLSTKQEERTEGGLIVCSKCGHTYGLYQGNEIDIKIAETNEFYMSPRTTGSSSTSSISSSHSMLPAHPSSESTTNFLGRFTRVLVEWTRPRINLSSRSSEECQDAGYDRNVDYVLKLNNHLGHTKQLGNFEWTITTEGPTGAPMHYAAAMLNGVAIGSGHWGRINLVKKVAAFRALKYLRQV